MERRKKTLILLIILLLLLILPCPIVLPILLRQSFRNETSNGTEMIDFNSTMMMTTADQSSTSISPDFIAGLSKETFSSWTTNGTILARTSTSNTEPWYICNNGSSASIIRTMNFTFEQIIRLDFEYTSLKIESRRRGKVFVEKFPICPLMDFEFDSVVEQQENNMAVWDSRDITFALCSTEAFTVKISLFDQSACIQDVNISLWTVPWA